MAAHVHTEYAFGWGKSPLDLLGPLSLRQNIQTSIFFAWMVAPADRRDLAHLRDDVAAMVAESAAWWNRRGLLPDQVEHAELTEGCDVSGADLRSNSRIMMRQSFQHCWMMLPEARRDLDEVLRLIIELLDEIFTTLEADQIRFR